ncbi:MULTISPECIES: radical SAM/SPASM domain-containing protein [unclassified Fusibacter]|uniref:radical SAM/SPASM domain-containing protein n=1 Tax=unclassified Fusibacter TaxID=2624464 RepID=UPI001013A068|nr:MULTISPECIES: radical SAM protein [unclassified Fusibacter]MCK8061463.1 radical SAM protein [Fusibacter sp. A2]NPE23648.1 radical SAM protein [Fusibacter sp. A1]RXV58827.1 radical SAM protein [Fusibacter sp. A1]
MKRLKFHDQIRVFNVEGIDMVGDLHTGTVIGLDEDGKQFTEKMLEGEVDFQARSAMTETENELLNEFTECGFFDDVRREGIKSAYVHVTDKCNLHCLGCYSLVEDRNNKVQMPINQVRLTLNQLKECGVKRIIFSGGEPFLRTDFWEICKMAKEELGFEHVSVITNGTLPSKAYKEAITYLDEIAVSIDGFDATSWFIRDEGIMPAVIETIDFLKSHVPVSLIATLHSKNIKHMKDYQQFAKGKGLYLSYSILSVSPDDEKFQDYLFSQEDFLSINENIKTLDYEAGMLDTPIEAMSFGCKGKCGVCSDVISIGADGSIYPCHMMHDDNLSLGNITATTVQKAVEAFDMDKIHIDSIDDCSACEFKYLCAGGCRGRSYYYHKELNRKDAYCPLFKAHFSELMTHLKEQIGMN